MEGIRVIRVGLGEITSNFGTYEGLPALFIEPVSVAGVVGESAADTSWDSLRPNSIVLQIHDARGINVILEDIASALEGSKKGKSIGDCTQ